MLKRRSAYRSPAGKPFFRRLTGRRHSFVALLAVMVTISAPFLGGIQPAFAGVSVAPTPDFPGSGTIADPALVVGQMFTGTLTIQNTSNGAQVSDPGTVSNITLAPSCTIAGLAPDNCAGGIDPGVFAISTTSTSATNCTTFVAPQMATPPITQFSITEGPPGLFTFVPSVPPGSTLVLVGGAICDIKFTVTVLKTPAIDADPAGQAGLQTAQQAFATIAVPTVPAPQRNRGGDIATIVRAQPTITTTATPATAALGTTAQDTAAIAGLVNPIAGATVTFNLFSDAACTVQVFTSTNGVTLGGGGTGSATSGAYSTTTGGIGTFHWVATYSGDANNAPVTSACADPNEQLTVTRALPSIVTAANPPSAAIGGSVSDTATVSGLVSPIVAPAPGAGTVNFTLFSDAACTVVVGTSNTRPLTVPVPPGTTGTATSAAIVVPSAGTYHWVATYSGDVNNAPAGPTPCLDPAEQVLVARANPTIATTATQSTATINQPVTDTATVSGLVNPVVAPAAGAGTVTFRLFSDNACTVLVGTSSARPLTVPVPPGTTGTATSDAIPVPAAGTYHWVATYSGDVNNSPAGPTACLDPAEQVTVTKATPTIATVANPQAAVIGAQLRDTATVSGLVNPVGGVNAGTVTFRLFSDAACTAQVFTSTNPVNPADGTAGSGAFTVTSPGTYHWVANYSGDANNNAAGPTPCLDPAEQVVVSKASPTLATTATPPTAAIGGTVHDVAQVSGLVNPVVAPAAGAGTVSFTFFSDAACNTQVFASLNRPVAANGSATSADFTVTAAGTYHWIATYSGDANNNAAGPTACSDPAEQVVVTKANPAITTTASAGVPVGGTVTDTANVTGGSSPSGTVTFTLYSDAACITSVFSSTNNLVVATGTATSGGFVTTAPGTYHWVAVYNGDANNNPAGPTACADPAEQVVVGKANPAITTSASPTVPVGQPVFDVATVSGGVNPTGTVTFTLFFNDATCAPASQVFTSTSALNPATGKATSGQFTPAGPGTYRWVASYSGDANNSAAGPTACADPAEQVVVTKTNPAISTRASSGVNVGGVVRDVATVTGLVNPVAGAGAGTVTFRLFSDVACATQVFTSTNPVDPATGTATSGGFTTVAAGTFHWVASYSGDANNGPAGPTACADPAEQVVVGPTGPSITTQAAGPVPVGGTITDTATLSGGTNPTGTITFRVFGPGDTNCATPLATSTATVAGNGPYTSAPFTTTQAGDYRWVAVYSGDANNAAAGPTACADPLEVSTGTKVTPTLVTVASAGAVGAQVFDTATLANAFNPTGTITFQLFDNPTCSGAPIFVSVKPVTGNGNVTSDPFILPATGVFHFVATYSGDGNNNQVGPVGCTDPNETVGVGKLAVSISTRATSGPVPLGNPISDTGMLSAGFNPTGTITFKLFGPNNANCTGTPIFTSVKPVSGNGTYLSDSFTPTVPGTYQWVVDYSGDANNSAATSPCGDPSEKVDVVPLPVITIVKSADPLSLPVPGGVFTFSLVVTNTSNVPLTIRTLVDNVYGDVTKITGSTCNLATAPKLAPSPGPGNTYSCKFPGRFEGPSGARQTDTVTVTATDDRGNTVTAKADAVVTITPIPPSITTTKSAAPPSLPEPGGSFTFNYSVTNTGPEPVTITSIVDDVYGDLNGKGTCAVGARLASGGSYSCSFTGNFFGNAGATQVDTITTTGRDDRGQTVTSQAKATVTITNVLPTINIVKTPDPVSRPEPGGSFRFTVRVTNTSFEPVKITSLVDNIYGDLNGRGSCAIGVVLAANGGTYACAFDGDFRGKAGDAQTDTVTVIGVDDDNTTVTAKALATVTLTGAGTLPVVPPPPPPVVIPPPVVVPPPVVQQVLVRTGAETLRQARLAGIFLLVGMTLVAAASWRFGRGGPGLAPVPSGPGGGGPGGGPWFGDGNWFGGARLQPPRGPMGGLGGFGLARPERETDRAGGAGRAGAAEPETFFSGLPDIAPVVPEDFLDVVARPRPRPRPVTAAASAPETLVPAVLRTRPDEDWAAPEVIAPEVIAPEVIAPEVIAPDVTVVDHGEVIVPTVVPMRPRPSGGLDAVAMDAVNAGPVDRRPEPPAPPRGTRTSRKFGGR